MMNGFEDGREEEEEDRRGKMGDFIAKELVDSVVVVIQ